MDNEEQEIIITRGINQIAITKFNTAIFVNEDTDYIPKCAGRKGIYNTIYKETDETIVFVPLKRD